MTTILPSDLRKRIEEIADAKASESGIYRDYWTTIYRGLAIRAAEAALDWDRELVCKSCGRRVTTSGCKDDNSYLGIHGALVTRSEHDRLKREEHKWEWKLDDNSEERGER